MALAFLAGGRERMAEMVLLSLNKRGALSASKRLDDPFEHDVAVAVLQRSFHRGPGSRRPGRNAANDWSSCGEG